MCYLQPQVSGEHVCKPSVPWVARPHWLQLLSWQVMVEAYRRDTASKDQLISELKATKKRLDSEVKELRQELMQLQGDKKSMEAEQARLQKEVSRVQQQMAALEGHLESVQRERDEMETHLQVWGCAGLPCSRLQQLFQALGRGSWRGVWSGAGTGVHVHGSHG